MTTMQAAEIFAQLALEEIQGGVDDPLIALSAATALMRIECGEQNDDDLPDLIKWAEEIAEAMG